jgi:hypothetical protein
MPFRLRSLPHSLPILSLLLCAPLALMHCGEDTAGPKSCEDIGDEATRSAPNQDEPAFKVISPNGGEHWKVGDSVTVRLGANSKGTSALAYLVVKGPAGTRRLRLPGTSATNDINPRTTCEVSFRIPATLTEGGIAYSLVSDTVKVRLAAYNLETLYFDESDAPFSIAP